MAKHFVVATFISFQLSINHSQTYNLCIHQCAHDDFPYVCSKSCTETKQYQQKNTECTLFGFQPFDSKMECELFANQQSPSSLYCKYVCYDDNGTNYYPDPLCRPPSQVCPLQYNGCDMFGGAQMFSSLQQCYHQTIYNETLNINKTATFTTQEKTKYIIVFQKMSWLSAEEYCDSTYKSHLATIVSDREFEIVEQLQKLFWWTNGIWIGLNDRNKEGEFEWSDGTKCTNNHTNIGCIPRNRWMNDEPNDYYNNEDCVMLSAQHTFVNDIDCDDEFFFLCQNMSTQSVNLNDDSFDEKTQDSFHINKIAIISILVVSSLSIIGIIIFIIIIRKHYVCVCRKQDQFGCGAWFVPTKKWKENRSEPIQNQSESIYQSDKTNNATLTCSAPFSHNDSKQELECILHDIEEIQEQSN